jgi:hypothetical protein
MYLNSLGGTNGYYYPGISDNGTRARNKHVGGFNDDDAYGGNANSANGVNQNAANSANATNLTQNAPQATSGAQSVGQSGDQTGQAGQAGQTGSSTLSPDFQSEENILSSLMDTSLQALNIVPSSEIAGTKISFSGLSYDVSSSQSAAVGVQGNQVGAAIDDSQSATLEGEGQIVTPDGTTYAFTIALQVGDEQQAAASLPLQDGGSAASGDPSSNAGSSLPIAANGLTSLNAPTSTGNSDTSNSANSANSSLGSYLLQLLEALNQATSPKATDPNAFLQAPATATSATSAVPTTSTTSSTPSSAATSSQPTINWDAIQQQTNSLIDMLDAISVGQTAGTTAAASAAAPTASTANNNTVATAAA